MDGMPVCHPIEDGGEICLRIEPAEFCGLNDGIYGCRPLPAAIGTQEQIILSRYCNTSQQALGQVEMGKTEMYLGAERRKADALLVQLAPTYPNRTTYGDVWPRVLARHAVTKPELNKIAAGHRKEGRLYFPDWLPGKKVPSDDGRIARSAIAEPLG